MTTGFQNLQRQVEKIHRAAIEAMALPRTLGDTKALLQQIAEEALSLSQKLSEVHMADEQSVEVKKTKRRLLAEAREFLAQIITTIWRSNNGP